MAAHENIHSISSGPLGNGCSHRRFSKRCSCGNFSLFKSHLWFKFVLKNPRKIQFFTLKNQKSKDVILEIRNRGQSFVVFVRNGRPEKKNPFHIFGWYQTMQSSLPSWMEASWMPLFFALFQLNFIPLFEVWCPITTYTIACVFCLSNKTLV